MEHFSEVNWASELGLDLEALMLERFHCTAHIKLAKIHKKRVARFEQFNRWVAFERHLDEAGQQWRDRETLRRALTWFVSARAIHYKYGRMWAWSWNARTWTRSC